jgi:hypothetical protein
MQVVAMPLQMENVGRRLNHSGRLCTRRGVAIYYKSNLFDQAAMASLLPPDPPRAVPKGDKWTLPPDIRQEIVNLHKEETA